MQVNRLFFLTVLWTCSFITHENVPRIKKLPSQIEHFLRCTKTHFSEKEIKQFKTNKKNIKYYKMGLICATLLCVAGGIYTINK